MEDDRCNMLGERLVPDMEGSPRQPALASNAEDVE